MWFILDLSQNMSRDNIYVTSFLVQENSRDKLSGDTFWKILWKKKTPIRNIKMENYSNLILN